MVECRDFVSGIINHPHETGVSVKEAYLAILAIRSIRVVIRSDVNTAVNVCVTRRIVTLILFGVRVWVLRVRSTQDHQ